MENPAACRGAADRLIGAATAQRARWGLTGLAAVFLLFLIASAGMRPGATAAPVDSQAEPLAVLGVAPGTGPARFDDKGQQRPTQVRASRT
ncbi:MAG: hypothetical protein DCF31_17405 [Alphaproteobacteria bacterium]|nr:MAG: hypothetical protein DCF31_17405 [Alphaproteobacteria bacterium]